MDSAGDIVVREAAVEDAEALADMNHSVHTLHREQDPVRFKPYDRAAIADQLRAWLRDGEREILIAEDRGRPVGYVSFVVVRRPEHVFGYERTFVHVDQISVSSAHRRLGIGKRLVDAVKQKARDRGTNVVELDVHDFNNDAQAFFAAQGFTPVKHRLASTT